MLSFLCLMLLACAGLASPAYSSSSSSSRVKSVFVLAGQSNMSGRGGVTNGTWDGVVPPECESNSANILRLSAKLKWVEAREPLHKDIDVNVTCGVGPGMVFANSVLAAKASANDSTSLGVVGLVPCAVGSFRGTKITQWARGSFLYKQLVGRSRAATRRGGGKIQAVLWYQGESDTLSSDEAELYKARLEKFFTDLRTDLKSPLLPIIQVAIASGQGPFVEKVREAQLGMDLPKVTCVDAKGLQLQTDHLHLSTAAQVQLGKMLAHAFLHQRKS